MRQILFIQGGGKDVHDTWDDKLVASLKRALGDGYEVRYPRMPGEAEPNYAKWSAAIAGEVDALGDGGVAVGHSIGAAIMINALADHPPKHRLAAIILISAPFVGEGGWPGDEFTTPADLGAKLPKAFRCTCFKAWPTRPPRLTMPSSMRDRFPRRRSTGSRGATIS